MMAYMKLNALGYTPLTAVFDCKMQAGCALFYTYPANSIQQYFLVQHCRLLRQEGW